MKKTFIPIICLLLPLVVFLFTGCPNPDEPSDVNAPDITTVTAVSEGASLQISWTETNDGETEVFYLYVEGDFVDSSDTQSYTFTSGQRGSAVGVTAWIGSDESNMESYDLSLEFTDNLEVWSTTDPSPDHPSFVQFTNGQATAVSSANADDATFYIGDATQLEGIHRWAGVTTTLEPAFADASSPYDFAPGTGNYTDIWPATTLAVGATYYIWIDDAPLGGSMGIEDFFAKVYVVAIDGSSGHDKVTLDISFQQEPGLRWLVD